MSRVEVDNLSHAHRPAVFVLHGVISQACDQTAHQLRQTLHRVAIAYRDMGPELRITECPVRQLDERRR